MKKIVWLFLLPFLLLGCQNSDVYSDDVYTAEQAKQSQFVSYGTITAIRNVKIQTNSERGSGSNMLGTIGGAVLGGFLGNTIGHGTGNSLATAAGAVGGAVVGDKVADEINQVDALELEIKEDSGATIAIVQKAEANQFYVGQKVRLISDGNKTSASPR